MSTQEGFEQKALLWSITTGILLILGIMVAITCLLVRYNHSGYKAYYDGRGSRRDRGKGYNGSRTVEGEYMDPRTDVVPSKQPHIPGKRPLTPSIGNASPSASINDHIYDVPACTFEVTASYESRSETGSTTSESPTPSDSRSVSQSQRSSSYEYTA